MAWNPLKKSGLEKTGLGRAGRGLDTIVRGSILEGKGMPAYKEGLSDVTKGLYGVGSKEIKGLDPNAAAYEERRKAQEEADRKAKEAAGMFEDIGLPGDSQLYASPEELQMQELALQGYDPSTMEAAQQGSSKFSDIALDPRFAEAQMQALSGVQDIAQSGGLTAEDLANLSRVQSDVGRADRGRREAIQDRMRRTGMTGSGMDLLAQLQSGQAATDRASQAGLDIAAMGQSRQRQALLDQANLAGGMRQQSYGEQSDAARAQDAIERFNVMNQQQAQAANQAAQNQAAQFGAQAQNQAAQSNWQAGRDTDLFNLQNRQATQQANVDRQNLDQQRGFENEMQRQTARSNAALGHATQQQQRADAANKRIGQTWRGAGQLAGAVGQTFTPSDENVKTDVESISEQEIAEFLEAVKPRKFKYKDKSMGEGQRVGFMAQDIEPTEIGAEIVVEGEQGKMIDQNNLMGAILDSLALLHKKQEEN